MNFHQSVFIEKKFFENIWKKVCDNYPLIFTLSDHNYDSENCFLKFKLYIPQICSVAKKL